jgi:hypothetical protein
MKASIRNSIDEYKAQSVLTNDDSETQLRIDEHKANDIASSGVSPSCMTDLKAHTAFVI